MNWWAILLLGTSSGFRIGPFYTDAASAARLFTAAGTSPTAGIASLTLMRFDGQQWTTAASVPALATPFVSPSLST